MKTEDPTKPHTPIETVCLYAELALYAMVFGLAKVACVLVLLFPPRRRPAQQTNVKPEGTL